MKTRILQLWEALRASYWFIPGLMALAAALLGISSEILDRIVPIEAVQGLSWLYHGGPEGARAVLSTVAGSMITVAGVTFSVTMVALALASSQFGPRILRNFMRDRGNQFVLGTFISTFLYCLFVLRTVRGVEESQFVPHISVTIAFVLAIASVAVLIYFIDHMATSIQAPNVVARVGADLDRAVNRNFPEPKEASGEERQGGRSGEEVARDRPYVEEDAQSVSGDRSGYVQLIDENGLLEMAVTHDLVVTCLRRPGEFAIEGAPIAQIARADRMTEELLDRVRGAFLYGDTGTDIQNVTFAVNQLVEIAVRALSPGINDPFTAMNCIDRLAGALAVAGRRPHPEAWLLDDEGVPRVWRQRPTFSDLLDAAFDPIREHGRSTTDVLAHLMKALLTIEVRVERREARAALRIHANRVVATAAGGLTEEYGRGRIDALYRRVRGRTRDVEEAEDGSGEDRATGVPRES